MQIILIADDNPLSLRFLGDALSGPRRDCICVADGAAAASAASERHFDLLLLDVHMPRMGGIEALRAIRAGDGPSRRSSALATSAGIDPRQRAELRVAGFLDVLPKPISIAALRAAVAEHLDEAHVFEPPVPEPHATQEGLLDDTTALAATGGDPVILATLRGLLIGELDTLPAEVADWQKCRDQHALRERLHRLEASAGFCGARGLQAAIVNLRAALHSDPEWPDSAITEFLDACALVRGLLASCSVVATSEGC